MGATPLRHAAAACLVGLPRLTGEACAHSGAFRRLLLSLHDALDGALMGLDEAGPAAAARAVLAAPAPGPAGATSAAGPAGVLLPVHALLGSGAAAASRPAGPGGAAGGPARPLALATAQGGAAAVRRMAAAAEVALGGVQQMLTGAFPCPVPLPWCVAAKGRHLPCVLSICQPSATPALVAHSPHKIPTVQCR